VVVRQSLVGRSNHSFSRSGGNFDEKSF
jgi:hypothetical protein